MKKLVFTMCGIGLLVAAFAVQVNLATGKSAVWMTPPYPTNAVVSVEE